MHVADRGEDGTQLLTALAEATAELPADRIAGAILVTDGQVHDADALDELPRPGAGAPDRQRRRLGPPRRRRDRARLRHRRRGGEPRRSGSRTSARRPGGGFAPLSISLDGTEPLQLRRAGQPQRHPAGDAAARRDQRAADRHARGRGRADRAQQRRHRLDQRRARPAAGAARLRRALSGRADLAEPAEVGLRGRPRPLHHPAPAGEAGLRAGLRALADRLPDPGAVHGEGRRVRPDHLRPLQAPRHPAEPLLREHRPLRPRRRRAPDRVRRRLRRRREPLPLAAARDPAGRRRRRG